MPVVSLSPVLDRLAGFEPGPNPVISLYLNARSGPQGRDQFETFVKKGLRERLDRFPLHSEPRESLERDATRIERFLETELQPSVNGVAIFACDGAGLFETLQLDAPIVDEHRLFVDHEPHLYPLAKLDDQYPRYAAVVADTNAARIFVFAIGELVRQQDLKNVKTKRHSAGGMAQNRFQRHVENVHLHHVKELVDALDRIVREDRIEQVVLAGDAVVIPMIRDQLPKHLAARVIETLALPIHAPAREVMDRTLEALRAHDAETDEQRVDRMYTEARSGGLGVVGPLATGQALKMGQVDELIITAQPGRRGPGDGSETQGGSEEPPEAVSEEEAEALVTRAKQTQAKVTFIENAELLDDAHGVGALLRFRFLV